MVSSVSVTLAMALTTTTGFCCRRSFTIAATRSMARASSTEVPPNFITIIGVTSWQSYGSAGQVSIEVTLGIEQLRIQHRRAGGSADGVVRKHGELPIEHPAGPQPAHRCGHACSHVDIKPRLRAVIRFQVHHRMWRGAG